MLSLILSAGPVQAATDLTFESATDVNEGSLHFLQTPPAKRIHHHQNRLRIDADSLSTGWVQLTQCHDNLDAVPRAQITFREGFVRDLKLDSFSRIESAWIEGASVQLVNVEPGARLCLSVLTRALRHTGNGYFNLYSGPYMRKFLDGYYPMRVTLEIEYPPQLLKLIDISPSEEPGFEHMESTGSIRLDAVFEGVLLTLIQFEKP
ncbi:MAG: hypothetical protein KKA22_03525 [Gammaproteobacteria bacterium]|nr:hypothetical protein [Gammaproteobacteria bacterium]MBU1407201.1 hypothetical protein [Gammaproteobacteria bacterium]MBU1533297.1 hypothetical protein [Gammaproteobacteria bacterium]